MLGRKCKFMKSPEPLLTLKHKNQTPPSPPPDPSEPNPDRKDPDRKELLLGSRLLRWFIDINIRPAEPTDASVIAEFNLLLAQETEGLHLEPARVQAGVAALLADRSKGIYYLAQINGVVAGQLMVTYEWSDWRNGNIWWIQSVYVRNGFRRRGVFRQLFKYLEKLAREGNEVCCLRLYMHAENHTARRSYEKLGMHRTPYEVFELEFEPGWEGRG
jgi:GNAT superfamily N-acetyltransferase